MSDIKIGFCIDQSGSMSGTEKETTAGFNAFKEEQVAEPGNAFITLTLFDTDVHKRIVGGDLKLVDDLGTPANTFTPSGGTALYDAVDETITEIENWHQQNPGFTGKTVVVILTDGGENSSKRVDIDSLNKRIADLKNNQGWEFIFMGSGGASWTEGQKFAAAGVTATNYAGAAMKGSTHTMHSALSHSVTASRRTGQSTSSYFAASTAHMNADPTRGRVDEVAMAAAAPSVEELIAQGGGAEGNADEEEKEESKS